MPKRIFLTGPPCAGKSTLAACISSLYGLEYVDLDALITEKAGKSIEKIFAEDGEAAFREIESDCLIASKASVVAAGGGAVLLKKNRELFASGRWVLLIAAPEILAERLKMSHNRPLLQGDLLNAITATLYKRAYAYCMADKVINTGLMSVEEAAVTAVQGVLFKKRRELD